MTKYIIAYPLTLRLYDTPGEAKAARTKVEEGADMELWRVEFDRFLPAKEDLA